MKTYPLVLILAVAAGVAGVGSRVAAQGKSWAGEFIVPTKPAKDIKVEDRTDDKRVTLPFSGGWPIKVQDERDGWLRILDGGRDGWVDKADFVPARAAPAYFHARVKANPKDTLALVMRGFGWLDYGDLDNAFRDFNECIRLDPTNSAAFHGRASVWSDKKQYGKAIKDFDEAVRLDPKYIRAFLDRGIAWARVREYDQAIKDFDEAIRLDPKFTYAFYNRAIAWDRKRDYDRAIKDYDEVIRLDPKDVFAFNNRGIAWGNKKEYDKAINDYNEAIRLNPKYSVAFHNRGLAWEDKKEYDKAIKDHDEAIRLDPKYNTAFNSRGLVWRRKKEYDKAIKDFDEAIRLDPRHDRALFNRSVTQMLMGRPEAAAGFQFVLHLEGWKWDLASNAVILGHLAARQAGDGGGATKFLKDSASKLDEAWPYPAVQFLRGEIDESALLALADGVGKRTEVRCYLGLVHALKGRNEEALAHLRWVRDHGNPAFSEYAIALAELDRLER